MISRNWQALANGLATKLVSMSDYKPTALKKEKFLTVVVSTYGEGEPPEDAETLYEFFCQTAKDFEERSLDYVYALFWVSIHFAVVLKNILLIA